MKKFINDPNINTENACIAYFLGSLNLVMAIYISKNKMLNIMVIVPTLILEALAIARFMELKLLTPIFAFMVRLIPNEDMM